MGGKSSPPVSFGEFQRLRISYSSIGVWGQSMSEHGFSRCLHPRAPGRQWAFRDPDSGGCKAMGDIAGVRNCSGLPFLDAASL